METRLIAKLQFKCPECDSENVLRDAYASWDFESQEWVLHDVYDQFACNDCGNNFRRATEIES